MKHLRSRLAREVAGATLAICSKRLVAVTDCTEARRKIDCPECLAELKKTKKRLSLWVRFYRRFLENDAAFLSRKRREIAATRKRG